MSMQDPEPQSAISDSVSTTIDPQIRLRREQVERPSLRSSSLTPFSTPFPFRELTRNAQINLTSVYRAVGGNSPQETRDPYTHPVEISSKRCVDVNLVPSSGSSVNTSSTDLLPRANAFLRRQSARQERPSSVSSQGRTYPTPSTGAAFFGFTPQDSSSDAEKRIQRVIVSLTQQPPLEESRRLISARPIASRLPNRSEGLLQNGFSNIKPNSSKPFWNSIGNLQPASTLENHANSDTMSDASGLERRNSSTSDVSSGPIFYRKSSKCEERVYFPPEEKADEKVDEKRTRAELKPPSVVATASIVKQFRRETEASASLREESLSVKKLQCVERASTSSKCGDVTSTKSTPVLTPHPPSETRPHERKAFVKRTSSTSTGPLGNEDIEEENGSGTKDMERSQSSRLPSAMEEEEGVEDEDEDEEVAATYDSEDDDVSDSDSSSGEDSDDDLEIEEDEALVGRSRNRASSAVGPADGRQNQVKGAPIRDSPRKVSVTKQRPRSASVTLSATLKVTDPQSKPPLIFSKFPNVPPVIRFVGEGEKVSPLPLEVRKLLKWRMSSITPILFKQIIIRSGFKPSALSSLLDDLETLETYDWILYFGKHTRAPIFKNIREYQKVNHFPGSFQLGRKDRLWRNLSRLQAHFGYAPFGFFPQTFCMPADAKLMRKVWDDGGFKHKWIIKPPASARGMGIRVVHKWAQIPKKRQVIVQRYICNPYLINESKFDIRLYVYVSSFDPLRIYLFEDGLVRFASFKYTTAVKSLNNRFMHLTNYSINKMNVDYMNNNDAEACKGHKWSLKALWQYLRSQGHDVPTIWTRIKDLILKTLISVEGTINSNVGSFCRRRYCVNELFGFDVLLDEQLKPWILEVNISPSLHSNSPLDCKIKGAMLKDMLNISGVQIPDHEDVNPSGPRAIDDLHTYAPSSDLVSDRRLWDPPLSPDEKGKHAAFASRWGQTNCMSGILDLLTPSDVRCLVETVDEMSRAGSFLILFPAANSPEYFQFFEQPRYSTMLNVAYLQRYSKIPIKGEQLLASLCRQKVHLQVRSNVDQAHQWTTDPAKMASTPTPRFYTPSPAIRPEQISVR